VETVATPRVAAKLPAVAPRLLAQVESAKKTAPIVARGKVALAQAGPAPLTVAKIAVPPKPERSIAAVTKPVAVLAKVQVPPHVASPEAETAAPRVIEKTETVAKTSGTPKSDWLVILSPEKKEALAKPAVVQAEVTPAAKRRAYDKAERDLLLRDYNAYVMRKSTDPFSNLK
jgi:hypothetical protein